MKIRFFEQDLIDAIGAGIYEIDVCKNGKEKPLYIGESVFVLVRCSYHLYKLSKNSKYFGFEHDIDKHDEYTDVTLKFSLIEKEDNTAKRKSREKDIISTEKPLTQSLKSDHLKKEEERIEAVREFLEEASRSSQS